MNTRTFLALAWPAQDAKARGRAADLTARLDGDDGWRQAGATDRLRVWTRPDTTLPVRSLPCASGLVLGDLFPMPGADAAQNVLTDTATAWRNPRDTARRLCRSYWGRYVALLHGPPTDGTIVFRDPSGLLEAMTWPLSDGLDVVASDLVQAPRWLWPHRPSLNWDRIAQWLAVPSAATTASLLDDIEVVGPGETLRLGTAPPRPEVIWTPADFAMPTAAALPDIQQELVRRVDACTAALVGGYDRVLMELSGGLDSSILAGALGATGTAPRVVQWLNYVDGRREADETAFAQVVTEGLGVPLTTAPKAITPLTTCDFAELGALFRPALGGADAGRDRDELDRLRATGAQAIVSGQGGDGVFFQFPSALVAADEVDRRGWSALRSSILPDVARRTRQSVWGVLDQVRAARRGAPRWPTVRSTLLTPEAQAEFGSAEHRWVTDARRQGVPPGKLLHVHGIAVTHVYRGPSRRLQAADLLMPLFSQPVTELCLSVAVPDLAGGSYDRPFARTAFAGRIPDVVLRRRTKGNLSAHFARLVAASAEMLRPYLMDGCLRAAGLLDPRTLERTFDPDHLLWGDAGGAADVLIAGALEAWVRHWQGQAPDSRRAPRRTS